MNRHRFAFREYYLKLWWKWDVGMAYNWSILLGNENSHPKLGWYQYYWKVWACSKLQEIIKNLIDFDHFSTITDLGKMKKPSNLAVPLFMVQASNNLQNLKNVCARKKKDEDKISWLCYEKLCKMEKECKWRGGLDRYLLFCQRQFWNTQRAIRKCTQQMIEIMDFVLATLQNWLTVLLTWSHVETINNTRKIIMRYVSYIVQAPETIEPAIRMWLISQSWEKILILLWYWYKVCHMYIIKQHGLNKKLPMNAQINNIGRYSLPIGGASEELYAMLMSKLPKWNNWVKLDTKREQFRVQE